MQKQLGATNSALSRMLGVSLATIEKRRSGSVKIPREVHLAMQHLLNYKVGE